MLHICAVLNGPPGCGKDTLAYLMGNYGFEKREFKEQLYKETAEYYGVNEWQFIRLARDRILKELPWAETGLSPRQMMISVSEEGQKPKFGNDYYGVAAAMNCTLADDPLVVFSDGGFEEELYPVADIFNHFFVFRLHRDGYSFENDSRDYIKHYEDTFDISLIDGDPMRGLKDIMEIIAKQCVGKGYIENGGAVPLTLEA